MKVVVAIDSFKGCLTSKEANQAAANGIRSVWPYAEIVQVPVSDGGEGFLEAFQAAMGGTLIELTVNDPLMRPVAAKYLFKNKTAVIEIAQASGLMLLSKAERNPMLTTSYGTGQLVADAFRKGAEHIIVGLGGSATSDAGMGMLRALQDSFGDTRNLKSVRFTIASDVRNPLYGENGAAHVFAPQKGASPDMVQWLDEQARKFAEDSAKQFGYDRSKQEGAGAAGGLGYAFLQYLDADCKPGIGLLLETIRFSEIVKDADLVITGEGSADRQTLMGKLPMGILRHSGNVPVCLIAGRISDKEELKRAGFSQVMCINPEDVPPEEAMRKEVAMHNISDTIMRLNRLHSDNPREMFPIVDESGTVIGSATRGECHGGSRLLHPVVHLHVFNSQGCIYLQKRPEWKDVQPGKWDTAVGGHIDYGETPEEALQREVREELGITDFKPEFVDRYVFESKRERELVYVHRTTYDGEICPSKDELDGGRFWTMQEIREAMGQDILTPNFESEFKRCFGKELDNKFALFFDIDGTLVSFNTHKIPPSTVFALTQAKANGHKVFIATGRPPLIITNLGAIEHLIDGYVTINGALCFVGNEVVRCKDIPKEAAQFVVRDALEKNYGMVVVGEKDVAVLDPKGEVSELFRRVIAVANLDQAKPLDVVLQQRILQLTPFFSEEYEHELMKQIPGCISGRWHPAFTDITAKGADKGEGVKAMAAHLGLNPRYTIAFGDGGNDASMIKAAGIGVAMGNALESLKSDADFVTTSVDDDGVLNALRHLGIV